MKIELSKVASAVLDEMARGSGADQAAIVRVCLESTLSQAIDRSIDDCGEEWFVEAARKVDHSCQRAWRDVSKPGLIYRKAMAAAVER